MPVGVQASRGPRAAVPNARIETALGHPNVFDRRTGEQRSFTQLNDAANSFSGPRRSANDLITVRTGPDLEYTTGLGLQKLTANLLTAGYTLDPGTIGFLHIIWYEGQSNAVDATGGAAEGVDDPDTGEVFNVLNPDPRIVMFTGGYTPHQNGVASTHVNTALDAAQIASVIPAYDGKNPLVPRNSAALATAVQLAAAFPSTDKFLIMSRGVGSTSLNERIGTTGRQVYLDLVDMIDAAIAYAAAQNLTPVMVTMFSVAFEAEGDAQSVANGLTPLNLLRTRVDGLAAPLIRDGKPIAIFALQPGNPRNDINHDPDTNYPNNPSPDLSRMGKINNVALAMKRLRYGTDSSGNAYTQAANFYPFPGYMLTARGPSAVEANAGVHYLARGHMELGEIFGIGYIKLVNGEDPSFPYVTSATRSFASGTVTLTTSAAGTLGASDDIVTDPYSAGVFDHEGIDYSNNGTAKFSSSRSGAGSTLTLAYSGLTGVSERFKIACGNSPKLKAEVINPVAPNAHTAPAFGLGSKLGQRCRWRGPLYGHSLYTGRPFYKRLLHQDDPVVVTLAATTLLGMLTEMGITPTMCLDASDSNCYPGSGTNITDLASGGATWNYKDSGGTAAVQFTSAGVLSSFNFDGNVYIASSATFADNDHKAAGSGVDIFVVDIPASLSANQYLLATNADDMTGGGAGPGRVARVTSSNLWGSVVRAGSGAQVYADNAAGTHATGKHVLMLGFDHASLTNWFMMNVNMQYVISPETATESYGTTPSSSAKAGGPYIGSNYRASYATETRLKNGWKIHKAARVPYVAPADLLPLFRTLSAQISKTVATQDP